jgi:hypothetical protein
MILRVSKADLAAIIALAFIISAILALASTASRSLFYFEVKLRSNAGGVAQMFYDTGPGFVERDSVRLDLRATEQMVVYRFPLPAGTFHAIRFDPIDRGQAEIVLGSARIANIFGRTVRSMPLKDFSVTNVSTSKWIDGGLSLRMGPSDGDSILAVIFPQDLLLQAGTLRWPFVATVFVTLFLILTSAGLLWLTFAPWAWRKAKPIADRIVVAARTRPCIAILVVGLASSVLSCYPVVFFGKSFVSPNAGMLYEEPLTLPGMHDPVTENVKGADVGAMFWQNLPYSFLQSSALLKYHELPLWNRYNSAGSIHLGQALTMFGDPLHMLVLAAQGASWAWDSKFVLAKFLFCWGIGLAVFLSSRHLPSSILLALSSGFIGFFSYRYSHPAFFSLCYSPWILVSWFGVTRTTSVRAAAAWSAGLVLASWAELTSGSAKEAYMLLLSLHGCGLIAFLFTAEGGRRRKLMYLLLAGFVFLLIASPICFTFLVGLKSQFSSYRNPPSYQIQPSLLIGLFDEIFYRRINGGGVFNPSANFLVLLGCLLGLAHFSALLRDRLFVGVGLAAASSFALVYGVIPPQIISKIPILGSVMHIDNTFSCVLIVQLFVLAGFGLRCLWREIDAASRRLEMVVLILGLGGILGMYFGMTQVRQRGTSMPEPLQQTGAHNAFYNVYVVLLICSVLCLPWVIRALERNRATVKWLSVVGFLCLLSLHWRLGMHLRTNVDQIDDVVMNPQRRVDFGVHSATIDFLKSRDDVSRTVGFGVILCAGYNTMVGIESIGGPEPLLNPYYRDLFSVSGIACDMNWRWRVDKDNLHSMKPFYDLLNVRYFLDSPLQPKVSEPSFEPLPQMDLQVYDNRTVWPRAFFVDKVFAYNDAREFIGMIGRSNSLPLAAVQANDPIALSITRPFLGQLNDARQVVPARNFRLTNNTTSFTIDAPGPGTVVLTESYVPSDFDTRINGTVTDYFRVNHAFRGVKIPAAGTYVISFSYWPHYFTATLWMAVVGLGLLAGWLVLILRQKDLSAGAALTGQLEQ